MKKYIFLLFFTSVIFNLQAQNTKDGLRLAQSGNNGTARFQAMSGAFGALGGDFSAININPASSAVFNNNQWSVSLSGNKLINDTNYFGTKTNSDKSSVNINQAAGVFVFENNDLKSGWGKFSLAINYENITNFDNDVFTAGTNDNSIANYFLSYANANGDAKGIFQGAIKDNNYNQLDFADQQAWLGYNAFVINPIPFDTPVGQQPDFDNPNISAYSSNVRLGGKYFQKNTFVTNGQNSKLNFNIAGQYQNWFNVGVNLNSHFTDYKESTIFTETNTNANSIEDRLKSVQFNNDIHTSGSGFSMQIGAIAKVNKMLRVGLAFESPIWYQMNDELVQSLQTIQSSTNFIVDKFNNVNPNTINIYEPYEIITPSKISGSIAVVFDKKGLLSADLTRTDYSNVSFGPKRDFEKVNESIDVNLSSSLTFKLGGEYKIKQWSLRGGYRLEQSPYKDKKVMGDLYGISSGLGYSWGDTKFDVSYAYSKRKSQNQFFNQGLTDFSTTTAINNNVAITLTIDF